MPETPCMTLEFGFSWNYILAFSVSYFLFRFNFSRDPLIYTVRLCWTCCYIFQNYGIWILSCCMIISFYFLKNKLIWDFILGEEWPEIIKNCQTKIFQQCDVFFMGTSIINSLFSFLCKTSDYEEITDLHTNKCACFFSWNLNQSHSNIVHLCQKQCV